MEARKKFEQMQEENLKNRETLSTFYCCMFRCENEPKYKFIPCQDFWCESCFVNYNPNQNQCFRCLFSGEDDCRIEEVQQLDYNEEIQPTKETAEKFNFLNEKSKSDTFPKTSLIKLNNDNKLNQEIGKKSSTHQIMSNPNKNVTFDEKTLITNKTQHQSQTVAYSNKIPVTHTKAVVKFSEPLPKSNNTESHKATDAQKKHQTSSVCVKTDKQAANTQIALNPLPNRTAIVNLSSETKIPLGQGLKRPSHQFNQQRAKRQI